MSVFATVAMWLPIDACVGQNIILHGDADDEVYNYGDLASYGDEDEGPIVERKLDLKDFKAVQNNYSATICYTQSRQYGVKMVGSQKAIDMMDFTVKDGTLSINVKKQFKRKNLNILRGIKLYISSPDLKSISNRGSLTIEGEHCKLGDLSIDNIGALTLKVGNLECQDLQLENRGSLRYVNGEVKASGVKISNLGAITLDLSFDVKETFNLSNRGSSKLDGKVRAKSYAELCQGASTDNLDIASDTLQLDIQGSGKINSSYKGKAATINGGGASNILMNVDCDKLSIESKGASKIKVTGTADDTFIENHGVAKVDVSGLNKF